MQSLQSDKGESKKSSPTAESSENPSDIQQPLPPCFTAAQEVTEQCTVVGKRSKSIVFGLFSL